MMPSFDEHASRATSRRSFLGRAGMLGLAAPLGALASPSAAGLLPAVMPDFDNLPICRVAAEGAAPGGALRKISLAWNATAICTSAAPVAKSCSSTNRSASSIR